MNTRISLVALPAILLTFLPAFVTTVAQEPAGWLQSSLAQPIKEIGTVKWGRDYERAIKVSAESGKPVFLLFQEIPGCQGCQDYGQQVLSHPLLVEAIEDLFVPTLVFNNKQGADDTLREKFNEPSWNYPVARYLDSSGQDLIARKDKIWDVGNTADRMIQALEKHGREVPAYLKLISHSHNPKLEKATFAMHCYWEGEAALGSLDGVVSTKSAWLDNKEVVELEFDPQMITYDQLIKQARKMECASNIYTHNQNQLDQAQAAVGDLASAASDHGSSRVAKDSDQKYYLRNSWMRVLPLTEIQAVKINAALIAKEPYESWLSPRQRLLAKKIKAQYASNKDVFVQLMYPSSEDDLAAYQRKLESTLAQLEK